MFRNLFAMFATLFEAGNKLANAANHGASFVEGEAAGFNERTSLTRQQDLKALRSKYSIEDRISAAEEARSIRNLEKTIDALEAEAAAANLTKDAA
jgi:hypothetical protein